ncbi:mucin-2-like [Gigantopelta aegis]|uniref:mucin-2-like n=1 Tax=Gigantopelta aegis TaxID=1735272 RepID=UPI001B8876CF|nr:mucin-2-like [Gigantopelta aegis]
MLYHAAVWVLLGLAVQAEPLVNPFAEVKLDTIYATSGFRGLKSNMDHDIPTVSVMAGSDVSFHCWVEVSSKRRVAIYFTWLYKSDPVRIPRFNHTQLVTQSNDGRDHHAVIRILNLQPADSGVFSCVVSKKDTGKTLIKRIRLKVKSPLPIQPMITPLSSTVAPGTPVNLTCVVPGSTAGDNSLDDVKFLLNEEKLESSKMTRLNSTAVYITVNPSVTSLYYCELEDTKSKPARIYVVNIVNITTSSPATTSHTTTGWRPTTTTSSTTSDVTTTVRTTNTTTVAKTPETTSTTLQATTSTTLQATTSASLQATTSTTPQATSSTTPQATTSKTPQPTTSKTTTSNTPQPTTSKTPQPSTSKAPQTITTNTQQITTTTTPQTITTTTPQTITTTTPQVTTSKTTQPATSKTTQPTTTKTPQTITTTTPQTTTKTTQTITTTIPQATTTKTTQTLLLLLKLHKQ